MKEKYKNICMFIRSPYMNNENERKCMEMNEFGAQYRFKEIWMSIFP